MSRAGRRAFDAVALAAWAGLLGATLAALTAAGHGSLAAPPLGGAGDVGRWLNRREPAEAVVALLRVVLLGVGWYLLATTVVAVVLRTVRAGRLLAAADALTLPAVRRLAAGAVGVTMAAGALTLEVAGGPYLRPAAAEVPAFDADADAVPVMVRLPEPSPRPARGWTVAPGDHFWKVAEDVLAGAWGRPATDAEITPYWAGLVAANRDRLADRGNADLLFPGQELDVPDPPALP